MTTTLIQIETALNSRPLFPLTNDPDDTEALTPGHFLIGSPLNAIPQEDMSNRNINSIKRWELTTKLFQSFWTKWRNEYLNTLQQRPKKYSQKSNHSPKINDLVIINDNNIPPNNWLLGRITAVHPGTDSVTRVVSLKTTNGVLKRPSSKICILPIDANP